MKKYTWISILVIIIAFAFTPYALSGFGGEGAFGVFKDFLEKINTSIAPATDNTFDSGSSSNRWRDGYFARNLSDGTNTATLAEIRTNLNNIPENIVYVNNIDDLPSAVGGKITLATNTVYEFKLGNLITLTDELAFSAGRIQLINALISTSKPITFVGGTGSVYNVISSNITFTGTRGFETAELGSGSIRWINVAITGTVTTKIYDITTTNPFGLAILDNVNILQCGAAGTFDGPGTAIIFNRLLNFSDGFTFVDNTSGVTIDFLETAFGQNAVNSILVDISGTVGQISITRLHPTPKSNEKVFNFDSGLTFDGMVVANSPIDLTESGVDKTNIFETGSLDQTTIGVKFTGNVNIEDSTALAQIGFQNNTAIVDIYSIDVPIKVNSGSYSEDFSERFTTTAIGTATYTGLECVKVVVNDHMTMRPTVGQNIELGCYVAWTDAERLEVTFTNATDKVNRTNHGLANGTSIRFFNASDFLPVEIRPDQFYWVVNTDTNDFEISDTEGGATLDFTDDGGTTSYYSLGGIVDSSEGESTASNTKVESFGTQSTVEVETGDQIEIFVDNHDSTSDIVVKGNQVIINK
jgi:hypothetical protein